MFQPLGLVSHCFSLSSHVLHWSKLTTHYQSSTHTELCALSSTANQQVLFCQALYYTCSDTFWGTASFPSVAAVKCQNLMGGNKRACVSSGTRGWFSCTRMHVYAATNGGLHPSLINTAWTNIFAPLFPFVCHFHLPSIHILCGIWCLLSVSAACVSVCIGIHHSAFQIQIEKLPDVHVPLSSPSSPFPPP